MKISELIKQSQELLDKHGDMEIELLDYKWDFAKDIESIEHTFETPDNRDPNPAGFCLINFRG